MRVTVSFIRNIESGDFLESFLISAISSVIFIRFYLSITNYPQIGNTTFHIAHLLWGGFFMLASIIMLLTYLNKSTMYISAILGGIGFGAFIDELGKYITRDNNYFYKPAIALIYIIFVLLFLLFRHLEKRTKLTKKEYLVNTFEFLQEAVSQDLDVEEKKKTLHLLRKCDPGNPIVQVLKDVFSRIDLVPAPEPGFYAVFKNILRRYYYFLLRNKWFNRSIALFFIIKSFIDIFGITLIIFSLWNNRIGDSTFLGNESIHRWGELLSSTVAGIFTIVGAMQIYRSRLFSYKMFYRSLLVSIFFTQYFVFYREQFSAIILLFFNILLLVGLRYMISQEMLKQEQYQA